MPGLAPKRTLALSCDAPSGRYQIGDDHARSWIVFGRVQQASKPGGAPAVQSTPCALQSRVLQRQTGFSMTRAFYYARCVRSNSGSCQTVQRESDPAPEGVHVAVSTVAPLAGLPATSNTFSCA